MQNPLTALFRQPIQAFQASSAGRASGPVPTSETAVDGTDESSPTSWLLEMVLLGVLFGGGISAVLLLMVADVGMALVVVAVGLSVLGYLAVIGGWTLLTRIQQRSRQEAEREWC
jgi:hypothetical protein